MSYHRIGSNPSGYGRAPPSFTPPAVKGIDDGTINLLVSTSTLAVGVDILGVRHVAIHGGPLVRTQQFSPLDVAQMISRAGRRKTGFALFPYQKSDHYWGDM
jgi:ATP-dependent helicase YprA (DUF1998 family)